MGTATIVIGQPCAGFATRWNCAMMAIPNLKALAIALALTVSIQLTGTTSTPGQSA